MKTLADQAERERFITAHGKNISVIAPAGVGKTRAIVDRIVDLARQPEAVAVDRLARLVVVTYSVRSAQEMQQRARAAIREAGVPPRVQRAFQQAFFGTIHSYCVQLLERFGHYLGLPSPVALLEDQKECWNRFLVRGPGWATDVKEPLAELFHFFAPEKLYALGREVSPGPVPEMEPCPVLELAPLLAFPLAGLHASTKRSLEKALADVRRWSGAWAAGDRFYPLPKCPDTKAIEFVELWAATFAPLNDWLRRAALAFGRRIANAYEAFRLSEAIMTYDDQVRLALRVLAEPNVQRELAEDRPSVLLDEAQDTDPRQFEVLLRVAGLRQESPQTEDQSFCIVGDFQQAIYVPRSDLTVYQQVHDEITAEPRGAVSRLEVTFRCDEAIIRFVNRIFPTVLHGEGGQSAFFDLRARHGAGAGQVAKWLCPDEPAHAAGAKVNAEIRARHEARFLAQELQRLGPAALGATNWSQVAILCPRRNWLFQIAQELRAVDLPVQLHSSNETPRDRTAGAWLTSLVWVVAHPEDSFEVAGVLREVFGVADDEMARYTARDGDRLRLDRRKSAMASGPLEEALDLLGGLARQAPSLPLHRAVGEIVVQTQLRKRLGSIREFEIDDTEEDLDEFLAMAFRRGAEGATLAELARELRLGLVQVRPDEEEICDAIQLLTSHKAKGLEWQTVILPYFFRAIETKTLAYPRLVQGEGGSEIILRDKADYATHAKSFVTERERQQLQRLLYVMCTRARHTLLMIDDERLYDGQIKRGGSSSGELLGLLGGVNRITWEALPETLAPTEPPVIAPLPEEKVLPENIAPRSAKDVAAAITRAQAIPRRITPHALAVHAPVEAEPETKMERGEEEPFPVADNPGILYGTWWHEFIEGVPWEKSAAAWQEHFTRAAKNSPEPERVAREWELFVASSLAAWLREPGRVIHRELPFLWLKDAQTCLEGVMDLAVYTPGESAWQVIDWKTNRPAQDVILTDVYRGQIGAYIEALQKMLPGEVKGSLYLTASGEWIPVG